MLVLIPESRIIEKMLQTQWYSLNPRIQRRSISVEEVKMENVIKEGKLRS
jgi:hypothetical protein